MTKSLLIVILSFLIIGNALNVNKLFGYRERHIPDKVIEYELLQESGDPSIEE